MTHELLTEIYGSYKTGDADTGDEIRRDREPDSLVTGGLFERRRL